MNSKEFKNYARLRNGVETVPSNIRKNYHLEKIPRGKQRGKFFFGSKIAALNFRKLFIEIEDKVIYGFDPNIIIIIAEKYKKNDELFFFIAFTFFLTR